MGRLSEVESAGSWPPMTSKSRAASATVVANGTDLVEGAGEGHQPVARHGAVGRLHPHHPAQGGGLADRPPGVGAEGQGDEAGGHGGGRASRRAPRHPAGVVGVAGRAEGRGLGRRAHGELVHVGLAHHHRAGPPQAGHHRGVVGGTPSLQDPRGAGGGHAPGAQVVLQGHRHAGQRSRVVAVGHRPVDGGGLGRARSAVTRLKAWIAPSPASMAARCSSTTSRARAGPGADRVGQGGRRSGRGHGASPRIRGTRNRWSSTAGAWASTSSRSRHGRDLVGPQHVGDRHGVGGGRHAGEVQGGHVGGVVEHLGQLPGEQVELLLGQLEAGQAGHVGHLVAGESGPARWGRSIRRHGRPGPPSTSMANSTTRSSISGASQSSVATW